MFQQLHALPLVVPQQGCVMQKPLLGDGLGIAAKLDVPKTVICMHMGKTWLNWHRLTVRHLRS